MSTKTKKTTASKAKTSKEEKKGKPKVRCMLTPKNVADYFLRITYFENDILTNNKIQKLVYYAQGFSLAMNNKPLFEEDIILGENGPIIPSLYDLYKQYGKNPIPVDKTFNIDKYSKKQQKVLDEVHRELGKFSEWKLRDLIREERTYKETKLNQVISKDLLKDYFLTQIEDEPKPKKKKTK